MSAKISVDRNSLTYIEGRHKLVLYVEWSAFKTAELPGDFEITADALETWTEPAGEPIDPARREALLDEIAEYYSKGPTADIIGKSGALLRGVSKFRFYLHIYPVPSSYYEIGRFLAIPTKPKPAGSREPFVLDFTGIAEWTEPKAPLAREYLEVIVARIQKDPAHVICQLDGPTPDAESQGQPKGSKTRGFLSRWF